MPLYLIYEVDAGDQTTVRNGQREAHLRYLDEHADIVSVGAGLIADEGEVRAGSAMIVDVTDKEAARRFAEGDPYFRAGIFSSVRIHEMLAAPWNDQLRKDVR